MSGKAYTMKEMKAIVEYLTEHKAYSEIKGRKMWTDLESSKITNRTWQSLKETFLKRILPDIHNPYYRLSLDQISSFRQGFDVEGRLNNKLQTRSVNSDSNDGDNKNDTEKKNPSSTNDKSKDKTAGEDPKQTTLRASTETLVLENCYETAEDIQKDLQSPTQEAVIDKDESPPKSMRELIIYSEPLTPMLQGVIDDFVTDEEGDEPKMQIVEPEETMEKNIDDIEENETIEISDSEGHDIQNNSTPKQSTLDPKLPSGDKNENQIATPTIKELEATNKESSTSHSKSEIDDNNRKESRLTNSEENQPKNSCEITQNNSADTLLPGNQEAFDGKLKTIPDKHAPSLSEANSRKRSRSQDVQSENKKRMLSKKNCVSDTDTSIPIKGYILNKSQFTNRELRARDTTKTSSKVKNSIHENSSVQENKVAEKLPQDITEENEAEIENPCLKSISLYAEQFSNGKYTDSESSHHEDREKVKKNETINKKNDKKNQEEDKSKKDDHKSKKDDDKGQSGDENCEMRYEEDEIQHDANESVKSSRAAEANKTSDNDIVILKSHSDTVTDSSNVPATRRRERVTKQQKDRALASALGFSSRGVSKARRKDVGQRKHRRSHNQSIIYCNVSSESSDWTSDTGSEYVSSPKRQYARKGRHNRKYLKPRPAPILSLEEEGGLFVIYGKKIYPVVKDGKTVKNYVSYMQEDETEQDESFWKLKYVQEKKKTAELTKLLSETKKEQEECSIVPPVLPTIIQDAPTVQQDVPQLEAKSAPAETAVVKQADPEPITEKNIVKIKFIKRNEEVQLEGHWSHINPVLAQVAQLFERNPEIPPNPPSSKTQANSLPVGSNSGESTPIEDVIEKVNKREDDIAKEIEKYYEEETKSPEKTTTIENVTKRRGRPRKVSSAAVPSPAKKAKLRVDATGQNAALEPEPEVEVTEGAAEPPEVENGTPVTTRSASRSPKKLLAEIAEAKENHLLRARRSTPRRSREKLVSNTKEAKTQHESDEAKYKFPSPAPSSKKSYTNKTNKATPNTNQRKSKSDTNPEMRSSSENIISIENARGCQEFDVSLSIIDTEKPSAINLSVGNKSRYATRSVKKTHTHLPDEVNSDSSNSFHGSPLHSMIFENSTLPSDIYNSESYRLLMNKDLLSRTNNTIQLESIKEIESKDIDMEAFNANHINDKSDLIYDENMAELSEININNENSSNVSLPTSPALSIVENISISTTVLLSANVHDIPIRKENDVDLTGQKMLNELLVPNVDEPLMEQECHIENGCHDGMEYHYNLRFPRTASGVSDSLLNKINIINLEESNMSDTLNVKLKNLLLESSKKTLKDRQKATEINDKTVVKKTKTKQKRSSTPRKRQSVRKLTLTNAERCVVEEHVESCSHSGRQSCPPLILISEHNDYEIVPIGETTEHGAAKPKRGTKKKDIIKVKITKPKPKEQRTERNKSDTNLTNTDVNDNESIVIQDLNDSVDLIHNHSETCISAHECMGDGVGIVDKSLLPTSPCSNSSQSSTICNNLGNESDDLTPELYSNDAQDGSNLLKGSNRLDSANVYKETQSPNSLMTDDLSDEIPDKPVRNTKWHLFSDDETTSTSCAVDSNSKEIGCAAILEQIFPVTCAVPDLSTITEMSRENGADSRKFSDDSNSRYDIKTRNKFFI